VKLIKILNVATYAGKIMLENGGETYRVEDVVCKICEAYDAEISCYATITGIMASATSKNGEHEAQIIRVKYRRINLDIVHKINDICRNCSQYKLDELSIKLKEIEIEAPYSKYLMLLAHAFAAGSFTLLFGGNFMDFVSSSIIGSKIFLFTYYFSKFEINVFFKNCIASSILTFFAVMYKEFNLIDNLSANITGILMLLVPGMTLTNSVRDLIAGDYTAGIARGVEALLIALSLATGSGFVLAILL